jgi:putative transposase
MGGGGDTMTAQRFSVGTQFSWQGQFYEIRRLLPGSKISIVSLQTNSSQTVTFVHLYRALLAGDLQFAADERPLEELNKSGYIDLSDCPPSLRAVAEYRLKLIQPLLKVPPQKRKKAIRALVEKLKAGPPGQRTLQTTVSIPSIYRWIRDFTRSGQDIRSLIPGTEKRGGKQVSRLKDEVEAIMKTVIDDFYCVSERKSIDYIQREIAVRIAEENQRRLPGEQLTMPSRTTLGRRIMVVNREWQPGSQAGNQDVEQYGQMEYPTLPLARAEMDNTRPDLIVVDEEDWLPLGRPTLTYCLDAATRYPLGYYLGFEPPSYLSAMECLYHTILPKGDVCEQYGLQHMWTAYGIPFTLVVDNGKEFVGRDLDDACNLMGIILERMPVKTPHFKASVERMFGTTNTGLLHTLPGTTFSNIGQRGDYDSLKHACISLKDLDQLLHIFLVDIYAEAFHRGLAGIPARQWEKATQNGFFPRVPASAKELQILLGRVAYRTIQPYGIELNSLRYNCSELASLRTRMRKRDDKQVKIKYNPSDLSRIHAYDPDEKQYVAVPALAQEYTQGLSLWKHRVIRNFVLSEQDTVDIVALGRAQRKIQAIVERSLQHKKLSSRAKIARWEKIGQASDRQTEAKAGMADHPAGVEAELPSEPHLDVILDLDELEGEGWGLSYDLPGA